MDSYIGLIIVHAALGAPFVLTTVLATLQGFNPNLVRASLSLGASPLSTFAHASLLESLFYGERVDNKQVWIVPPWDEKALALKPEPA